MSSFLQLFNGWFRPKVVTEKNALEIFERLWSDQEAGRKITFMSIAFNTSATSTAEVMEVGLSYWSKRGIQQQVAYHWRVVEKVETKDVVEFGNPDTFDFGTTHAITACDVTTVLEDWAIFLSGNCDELCMVVYGEQTIKTLERQWMAPVPVTILDLEIAWHQRQNGPVYSTLEEVLVASEDVSNTSRTLDNAGNQAYCLLALLKSLGNFNNKPKVELEDVEE